MADFIVSYDLHRTNPDPYSAFIEEAGKRGWGKLLWGPQDKEFLKLPNTTLAGTFADMDSAFAAFEAARSATEAKIRIPVTVEKMIIAQYTLASFNSDERYKPQK